MSAGNPFVEKRDYVHKFSLVMSDEDGEESLLNFPLEQIKKNLGCKYNDLYLDSYLGYRGLIGK